MAEVRCSIDDLAGEIVLAVRQYTDAVGAAIAKEVEVTAQAVLQEVALTSAHADQSGDYRRGWTRKKEGGAGWVRITIHNAAKPWLVHLLEKGHAKRGGGRVQARPHVQPAYDAQVRGLDGRIKEIIRKGG